MQACEKEAEFGTEYESLLEAWTLTGAATRERDMAPLYSVVLAASSYAQSCCFCLAKKQTQHVAM